MGSSALESIAEGEEEPRQEAPTLPTKQKPVRTHKSPPAPRASTGRETSLLTTCWSEST